jgi:hypothetical protein
LEPTLTDRPFEAPDFWTSCGYGLLAVDAQGHLQVTDEFLRMLLRRPELAPIEESCENELALHARLLADPRVDIAAADLAALRDRDAAENYAIWLRFRGRLLAYATLEASYLALFQGAGVDVPPILVRQVTQVLLRHVLGSGATALQARVAEMLFRAQSIAVQEDGAVMAADYDTVNRTATETGFGTLVDLLRRGAMGSRSVDLDVLNKENAHLYWNRSESFDWVVCLNRGEPALEALCQVLGRWIRHFLQVRVTIDVVGEIDYEKWVWHTGLDIQSSSILNDLFRNEEVSADRLKRLMCIFYLQFESPPDMLAEVRGKPVYLAMAVDEHFRLQLKPQNLLINLPLCILDIKR